MVKIDTSTSLNPTFSMRDMVNAASSTGFREPTVDALFLQVNGTLTVTATNGDLLEHEWWNLLSDVNFSVNADDNRIKNVDGETLFLAHLAMLGLEHMHVLENSDSTSTDVNARRFVDDSGSAVDWNCMFPIFSASDTMNIFRGRDWGINVRNFDGSGSFSCALRNIGDTTIGASPECTLWARFREQRGREDGQVWVIHEQQVSESRPSLTVAGELIALIVARYTDTAGVRDRREHLASDTDFSQDLAATYTTIHAPRLGKERVLGTDQWLTANINFDRGSKNRGSHTPDYFASNYYLPLYAPATNQRRTDLPYFPGNLVLDFDANFTSTDKMVMIASRPRSPRSIALVTSMLGDTAAAVATYNQRARVKGTDVSAALVAQSNQDIAYGTTGPVKLDYNEKGPVPRKRDI